MDCVETWFPDPDCWDDNHASIKVPVYEKVVSLRHGDRDNRREIAARLISAAARVVENRPAHAPASQVAALICWPDLWPSEVCVFFDRKYAQRFQDTPTETTREIYEGGWHETGPAQTDLLRELDLSSPPGFGAAGRMVRHFTEADPRYPDDEDYLYENEHWVIAESTPDVWRNTA